MPNLTTVTVTNGVPTAGTGTVSTLDNLVGTAGAASGQVLSVQGIASMTAVKVDGSAVTQPVSGTVSANATQTGTWTVQPGNTANTTPWKVQLYDGTTALPVLAGSSGAPAASAPALAVSVRDANANGQAAMSASAPVVIASDQSAVSVKATVSTTGGATPAHYFSAASTNATSTKASAGTVYGVFAVNTTATVYYLKLYNKASAPTVGTDVPVLTIPVPASTSGAGINLMWPMGVAFGTGIAWALTAAAADADTGVAATGVTINLVYA